jgi:hypothetical protein
MMVYSLTRDVTREECDWLDWDLPAGKLVYEWTGHTYGAITREGIAVTEQPGELPFFELPYDALGEPALGE